MGSLNSCGEVCLKPAEKCRAAVSFTVCIAGMLVLAAGCAAPAHPANVVVLDEDFRLQAGRSAMLSAEGIELGFETVGNDSRCGKGDVCITEGDAAVRIWLRARNGPREEHELHTAARLQGAVEFGGFSITLVALHPEAISGRAIDPGEYVATLRITRGTPGGEAYY